MQRRYMVWAPMVALILSVFVAAGTAQPADASAATVAKTQSVTASDVHAARQLRNVKVWLKRKLVVRHGHVARKAVVAFKNTSRIKHLEIDCGGPHKVPMQRFADPGQVVKCKTGRRVMYFMVPFPIFDNGKIYTRSGRIVSPIA